jgi:chemotaxis protein CheD
MTARATPETRSQEVSVGVAQSAVRRGDGAIVSHGLGSCVAIVLYDAGARVAGLAHVLLPNDNYSRDRSRPAKFAESAVPHLVAEMRRAGAGGPLTARLVGGASMFGALLSGSGVNMGERNVVAAREALARARIPVIAEDVGGDYGRSVVLCVQNGSLTVRSMQRGTREL